jgi:hypothetical protein
MTGNILKICYLPTGYDSFCNVIWKLSIIHAIKAASLIFDGSNNLIKDFQRRNL